MGFDWGKMAVEACFETDGHQCLRVRSMVTGTYVDIQMSKGGRKMFVLEQNQADSLKGFNPSGGKKQLLSVVE
jgi:hypothetical protein